MQFLHQVELDLTSTLWNSYGLSDSTLLVSNFVSTILRLKFPKLRWKLLFTLAQQGGMRHTVDRPHHH
jgi:hypothetical protein